MDVLKPAIFIQINTHVVSGLNGKFKEEISEVPGDTVPQMVVNLVTVEMIPEDVWSHRGPELTVYLIH